jgi:hypothetical protein
MVPLMPDDARIFPTFSRGRGRSGVALITPPWSRHPASAFTAMNLMVGDAVKAR